MQYVNLPLPSGGAHERDHRLGVVLGIEAVVGLLLGLLLGLAALTPGSTTSSTTDATTLGGYAALLLIAAAILATGSRRMLRHAGDDLAEGTGFGPADVLFGMAGSFVLFLCGSTASGALLNTALQLPVNATGPAEAVASSLEQLASYLGMAVSVWLFVVWRHHGGLRDLGWRRPRTWQTLLLSPVIAVGVVAVADYLLAPINSWLLPFAPSTQCAEVLQQYGGSSAVAIVLAVIVICVMAPLFEESVFRGFLYGGLRRRLGVSAAAGISGAVFAVYHLQPDLLLPLFFLGVVLAIIYEETGAIWPSMVVHALFNLPGVLIFLSATHC